MSGFDLIIKQDKEEIEAAEVFVRGTIDGRQYWFLLDTGAAITSIKFDDYTAGFDCISKRVSSGLFEGCTDDLIIVPTIELGPISKQNFMIARIPKGNPEIRNLIGMDFLKTYRCHFLFDEHRVTINTEDDLVSDCRFQTLTLGQAFHPYVEVQFGTHKAQAVWDTGAGITVVDMGFIQAHAAFFQEVGVSTTGTDSTGSTRKTPMFIMAKAVIGSYEFPPHKVAGVDMSPISDRADIPMDLVLGYSTLSKANWVFDFPRRKWAVAKFLDVK